MNKSRRNMIAVIFVLLIGLLAFCSYEYAIQRRKPTAQPLASHGVAGGSGQQSSPTILKAANINSRGMAMPVSLPTANAGSVEVNQYYLDGLHVLHGEYKYTEPNPSGTTPQVAYAAVLQSRGWQNIKESDATITAIYHAYAVTVTFAAAGPDTTSVDVLYTLTPNYTNAK